MNRRLGWLMIGLGVILALGTGALVFYLLRQQEQQAIEQARSEAQAAVAQAAATLQIPVAARPLEPGTILAPGDLLIKDFPVDLVPTTAITSSVGLENQLVVAPIGAGETFSSRQLAGAADAPLSSTIPSGKVVFAFPVDDLLSELNIIRAGDRVDLLLSVPVEVDPERDPVIFTGVTIESIEVFRVIEPIVIEGDEESTQPLSLLLLVEPDEAVLIKHTKDVVGVVDFTLRSLLDREPFEPDPINSDDLIRQYLAR